MLFLGCEDTEGPNKASETLSLGEETTVKYRTLTLTGSILVVIPDHSRLSFPIRYPYPTLTQCPTSGYMLHRQTGYVRSSAESRFCKRGSVVCRYAFLTESINCNEEASIDLAFENANLCTYCSLVHSRYGTDWTKFIRTVHSFTVTSTYEDSLQANQMHLVGWRSSLSTNGTEALFL